MRIHSEYDQKVQGISSFDEEDAKWDSCFLWGYITGILFSIITYCLVVEFMHLFDSI